MKLTLIIANLIAAIALYILGGMAVAAYRANAISAYEELKSQHVLVERPDYDIEKQLVAIADAGGYYFILSRFGVVVCLVNAAAIGFIGKRPKADA